MSESSSKGKQQKISMIVIVFFIISTVVFIWNNSLESVAVSSEKSSRWLRALTFILEPVLGEGNVTDHLIRKLAHFAEFALLGI